MYRQWLKYSIDKWRREPEEKYLCRPLTKPTSTPSKPEVQAASEPTELLESKTPPGTPPLSPGFSSGPDTPTGERVVPVETEFMLDQDELKDMDDELAEFLGSGDEEDRASQTTDNDTDDASMTNR